MDPITLIIVAVLGVLAAGMVFSSTFRNKVLTTLRIRSNAVLDKATTAIEREKDDYHQLMNRLPAQRSAVTSRRTQHPSAWQCSRGLRGRTAFPATRWPLPSSSTASTVKR